MRQLDEESLKTERCNVCKSRGFILKDGYTVSDRKQCYRCNGTGEVPYGSQKKWNSGKRTRPYYESNKLDGVESLKNLEPV